MKIKQKLTMEFIKKQMQNPAYFLAAVTTILIAVTLVFGLASGVKNKITNKNTNIATSTDATPTDATPTDATPTDAATAAIIPVNEENYIEGIAAVITGTYDDTTPVTENCISTYENEYFDATDIESIEACDELCDFSTKDACYYITISGKIYCYGTRFTVSDVSGAINYIGIYEIPYAAVEIDAGITDIEEASTGEDSTEETSAEETGSPDAGTEGE